MFLELSCFSSCTITAKSNYYKFLEIKEMSLAQMSQMIVIKSGILRKLLYSRFYK